MATVKFYDDKEKNNQVYPDIDPDGNYPGVTVGLANNLVSATGTLKQGTIASAFIYRLTADGDSTSDGYAELKRIIGTTSSSTIPESIKYNLLTTGVSAISINSSTFKSKINTSGTYSFIYTPIVSYDSTLVYSLNKSTFANYVGMATGTYDFTYTAVVSPVDTSSVISTFTQATFVSKVNETPDTYTFTYDGSNWKLNDSTNVTMSQYGITTKGTETSGTTITVYYTSNSWYYNNSSISMSNYGIATTGTEKIGDTITISYTKNEWQLDGTAVTLSNYGISITDGNAAIDDNIQVIYVKEQVGVVQVANPQALYVTGFNKFNVRGDDILKNYTINSSGNIGTSSGYYVVWVKVLGGNTYTVYNADETAIVRVAYNATEPTSSTTGMTVLSPVTTTSSGNSITNTDYNKHYTPSANGYLVVSTTAIDDLCINITWNGYSEFYYESYWDYTLPIHYVDEDGTVITDYGMPYLSNVYYDEMNYDEEKYYKRTARIEYSAANLSTVKSLGTPYVYDDNYIYYGLPANEQVTYNLPTGIAMTFQTSDYGTEEFLGTTQPVAASILYQKNLKDKLATEVEILSDKIGVINGGKTTWEEFRHYGEPDPETDYENYIQYNNFYPNAHTVLDLDNAIRKILGLDVDTFSTSKTYAVGDYVVYNLKLWKCKTAITSAGAWDSSKWEESYLFKAN